MLSKLRCLSVVVCASQDRSSVEGLIKWLESDEMKDAIKSVEFVEIPYNGIDSFRFKRHIDVLILVHSINNRRFAITNVTDALYDKFLQMAQKHVGRDKLAVVVHDMPYPTSQSEKDQTMENFRSQQPLTFESAKLAFTCGKLGAGQETQIADDDIAKLKQFLENARHCDEVIKSPTGDVPWIGIIIAAAVGFLLFVVIPRLFGDESTNILDAAGETEL